jgi:hypothetical protein
VKRTLLALALAALAIGPGCVRYYKVTDPNTRDVYYTKDIDKRDSGAAEFVAEPNRAKVTLQSSVIEKISKEDFEVAVGTPK